MSNTETKFPTGISGFKPNENAPSFVKGDIVIKDKREFIEWLGARPEQDLRLQLLESKGGKYYLAINDYKAKASEAPASNDGESDLPF